MLENLLCISRDLLECLSLIEFAEDEKDYIVSVVRKAIDLSLLELNSEEK